MTDPAVTEALDFSILPVFANAIPSEIAAFHECFNRPPTDKPPLSHRCPYADADPTDNRPDCPAATGEERRGLCSFSRSEYGAALATALADRERLQGERDEACHDWRKLTTECERLREALGRIEHGCMFPEDDVQRAIRDVSRAAMTGGEACEMYDKLGRDGAGW
jgi:hypothetical protein